MICKGTAPWKWASQVKKVMTKKSSSSEVVLQAKFNSASSNAIETYPHSRKKKKTKKKTVIETFISVS